MTGWNKTGYWWSKAQARLEEEADLRGLAEQYGESPKQDGEFWMWIATASYDQISKGIGS